MEDAKENKRGGKENSTIVIAGSIIAAAVLISASIIYVLGSKNSGGAAEEELDPPVFAECLINGGHEAQVAQDYNDAQALGVDATPYSFVGGMKFRGLASVEDHKTAIQNALAGEGTPGGPEITERDYILGNPDAPVTLIEYGDYQCPFCARFFAQVEKPIKEQYIDTGQVKMVYRNFAFLGPESLDAAVAAECAGEQGKFWEYHDALFTVESRDGREGNGNLNRALFLRIARDLGLE